MIERELPALSWGPVFRALRLLELSGEVVQAQVFDGVPGLQFASRAALRLLEDGLPADRVAWMSAVDPASPCGLGLPGLPAALPRRVASAHLVIHGTRLVAVAERSGRSLTLAGAPDDPALQLHLGFLRVLLGRQVRPARAVVVETVNGEPAASSPYRPALERLAHVVSDGRALRLMRRY